LLALVLSLTQPTHLHHPFTHNNKQFVKGDIQSMDLLKFILESERIDTIMHFAAQTHVDNSFGNSLAFTVREQREERGRSEAPDTCAPHTAAALRASPSLPPPS
jgi:hypothetical protein